MEMMQRWNKIDTWHSIEAPLALAAYLCKQTLLT